VNVCASIGSRDREEAQVEGRGASHFCLNTEGCFKSSSYANVDARCEIVGLSDNRMYNSIKSNRTICAVVGVLHP
jgi:hypothetical protein